MRLRWSAGGVMMLVLTLPTAVVAQAATRVELDNDSFNFWQPPKVRADREYSQGTRIMMLRVTHSGWSQRLLRGPDQCQLAAATRDCRMSTIALTQAIYTPMLAERRRLPGERPYAGWLGFEAGLQRERRNGLMALALELGVTGDASLAEPAQKAVHKLFRFQRPEGWETQLPTELAVVATYRGARTLIHVEEPRSRLRLQVAPIWTVRAGTVATDATLGAQLTLGLRAPAPWRAATNLAGDRWSLYLRAGAQQTAVAHNLFLDGSTFTESASVEKLPWVVQTDFGIGLRTPIGLLEWQVHSRGREYRLQPKAHAYSTISFAIR
jgi:lipid A 3-O-deacylase